MIEPNSPAVEATLSYYGHLKTITQVIAYIGIATTASLSVFDLLYKQKSDPLEGHTRYRLNRAGRARLIMFLGISLITITSTILKDYADNKLDKMAQESAQAKLQETLGGDFNDFAAKQLGPSVKGLRDEIQEEKGTLDSNISQAMKSLDGALGNSIKEIQRGASENATEAEMSTVAITSFELEVWVEGHTNPDSHSMPLRLTKWYKQTEPLGCNTRSAFDDRTRDACTKFRTSVEYMEGLKSFVTFLDPHDSGTVEVIFILRSFTPTIKVSVDCDPVIAIEHPEKDVGCADVSDMFESPTKAGIKLLNANLFYPADIRLIESGSQQPGKAGNLNPLADKFGRDADLQELVIGVTGNSSFAKNAPKQLTVSETLTLADTNKLTRNYKVRLMGIKGNGSADDPLTAEYQRF